MTVAFIWILFAWADFTSVICGNSLCWELFTGRDPISLTSETLHSINDAWKKGWNVLLKQWKCSDQKKLQLAVAYTTLFQNSFVNLGLAYIYFAFSDMGIEGWVPGTEEGSSKECWKLQDLKTQGLLAFRTRKTSLVSAGKREVIHHINWFR